MDEFTHLYNIYAMLDLSLGYLSQDQDIGPMKLLRLIIFKSQRLGKLLFVKAGKSEYEQSLGGGEIKSRAAKLQLTCWHGLL